MNKTELFNKITRNKQRNQSQCDQMKVLNIKSSIISYILTERGELRSNSSLGFSGFGGFDNIVEVMWYNKYCLMKTDELVGEYRKLLCRYMTLSGLVNYRSKHIKRLRSLMKYQYKSISFSW